MVQLHRGKRGSTPARASHSQGGRLTTRPPRRRFGRSLPLVLWPVHKTLHLAVSTTGFLSAVAEAGQPVQSHHGLGPLCMEAVSRMPSMEDVTRLTVQDSGCQDQGPHTEYVHVGKSVRPRLKDTAANATKSKWEWAGHIALVNDNG